MANNIQNNDIDPRLEQLLKEELANRAKKIEVMKQWRRDESDSNERKNKSRLRIMIGAVSSMAAMFLMGIFLMPRNGGGIEPDLGNAPFAAPPTYRGVLVSSAITDAIDAKDTATAILLINESIEENLARLQQLDSIALTTDNQEEIEDERIQINLELGELKELEQSLK